MGSSPFARTLSEQQKTPSTTFCASLGRTPNDGGGLLPPGRAARISLFISDLGIFRVVKITTLISVKQLSLSNLQVAPTVGTLAKNASIRNLGDA